MKNYVLSLIQTAGHGQQVKKLLFSSGAFVKEQRQCYNIFMEKQLKVMFLCTGNSCRSQMAEGFARALGKGRIEAHSAGIMAAGLNSRAVLVMKEAGVDISGQHSKEIDERLLRTMDMVITLCDNAAEACPWTPPHIKVLHWPVKDPVGTKGSENKIMTDFRRARDEIKEKIVVLLKDTLFLHERAARREA
jgi:arsenate reductase